MARVTIGRSLDTGDSDVRQYFVPFLLTAEAAEAAPKGAASANPILEAVLELDGVEFAVVQAYTLTIKRGAMWEWEPVERHVKRLLTSFIIPLSETMVS